MACGQGDYDWVPPGHHLKAAGYDSALTANLSPVGPHPGQSLQKHPFRRSQLTRTIEFIQDHGSAFSDNSIAGWSKSAPRLCVCHQQGWGQVAEPVLRLVVVFNDDATRKTQHA
jgi:hypothetical protein